MTAPACYPSAPTVRCSNFTLSGARVCRVHWREIVCMSASPLVFAFISICTSVPLSRLKWAFFEINWRYPAEINELVNGYQLRLDTAFWAWVYAQQTTRVCLMPTSSLVWNSSHPYYRSRCWQKCFAVRSANFLSPFVTGMLSEGNLTKTVRPVC